jgi:hypothetical protein
VWFSIIELQAIHRGTFCSVRDLTGRLRGMARLAPATGRR